MPVKNSTISIRILETGEKINLKTNDKGYTKLSYFLILDRYRFLIEANDGKFNDKKEKMG